MEKYIYYFYKNGNEKLWPLFKKAPCHIKVLITLMFIDLAVLIALTLINENLAWIPATIEVGIVVILYFVGERRDVVNAEIDLDNYIQDFNTFEERLRGKGLYNIEFIKIIKKRYEKKVNEINCIIQKNDKTVKKGILALLVPITIDLIKTIATGSLDYNFFGIALSIYEIIFLAFALIIAINTLMTTIYDSKMMEYKKFIGILDSIILKEKFKLCNNEKKK